MFDALIAFSIRNRLFVVLAAALLLVYGAMVVPTLPVDVFPDLNRPTVTVLTEYGGFSPEEVEVLVSRPVEIAMNGATGVERVRSQSGAGLSVVWVEFSWETDILVARQQVAERLGQVRERLPEGAEPAMGPMSSIMGEILLVGLVSPDGSWKGPALRRLGDTAIAPRLQAISGVSQVIAIGGGVEQIQVEVQPEALAARKLTLDDVRDAAALAQANRTGGFLERKSQESLIRILSKTADVDAIGRTAVKVEGDAPVALSSVAHIHRGVGTLRGDAGVNAHPGVILSVQKQPGASTVDLNREVARALADLNLPVGVEVVPLFRQADFIESSILNVEHALRDGAILVALVLILFLMSWRTTAITLTAIPLSFVVSALVLHAFGLTVNTMTLGGLAIAVGELVDDAIVDVENVFRRLRENQLSPTPQPFTEVILAASSEVRSSIVFSTVLVVLVFVPLFAMDGIEGRLFAPLGIAYITSILASMGVSLTLTPALSAYLLPRAALHSKEADSWLVRKLKALDTAVLSRVLRHPGSVLVTVATLVLMALLTVPFLGTSFLPPFNEGTATIGLLAMPGTSLAESNRLGTLAERLILSTPEVTSVGRRTGRAELDEHAEGVHSSEIDVDFAAEGRDRTEVLAEIRTNLAQIPGVQINLGQPIGHRLDHLLSGVRAEVAIKLFGDDLGELRATAEKLRAALEPIDGLVDLQVERQVLVPQVQIAIDREAAFRYGVAPGHLAEDIETAFAGTRVGQVTEDLRTLDLVVRVEDSARSDLETLRELPIALHDGRLVTLEQVAEVRSTTGPNQIFHEGGQRRIVLSANTAGRDLGSVVRDIEATIAGTEFPPGMTHTIGGQFESQRSATRKIGILSLLSLAGMYLFLYAHFGSHTITLQVLINLPLALVGSVAALWIADAELSVATLVGFITLCGIASRNTILMISHYQHLMKVEGEPFGEAMVIRGSLERLVPVLMTALTAGFALIPLAFAGDAPGKEILTPVAQVILGGLVSSTLLDMIVTPTLFLHFGRRAAANLGD